MKSKTVEQLAEVYTSKQYIDYGDSSYRAEEQIEEAFIAGFSARKEIEQRILTDTLNKYRSWYQQQTQNKMNRTPNFKYETELLAKIELLKYLQNKL